MTNQIIDKLKFAAANGWNVLLRGSHGIGKSSIITQAIESQGLRLKYFSASTLDPWTDLVGIPIKDDEGYIQYIKPKWLKDADFDILVFDEFNRSPKKVRNAVMELIQFKAINGETIPNLKAVWAAINPEDEDDTYDVERLDPALQDRFHYVINLSEKPDLGYFSEKYGDRGRIACKWWNSEVKDPNKVSPRRLEYVLIVESAGGSVRDVLPRDVNASSLILQLAQGSFDDQMNKIIRNGDAGEIKKFLSNDTAFANVVDKIEANEELVAILYPHLKPELLLARISKNPNLSNKLITENNIKIFLPILNKFKGEGAQLPQSVIKALGQIAIQNSYTNYTPTCLPPGDESDFEQFKLDWECEGDTLLYAEDVYNEASNGSKFVELLTPALVYSAIFSIISGFKKSTDYYEYPLMFDILNTCITMDDPAQAKYSRFKYHVATVQGFLDRNSDKLTKPIRVS